MFQLPSLRSRVESERPEFGPSTIPPSGWDISADYPDSGSPLAAPLNGPRLCLTARLLLYKPRVSTWLSWTKSSPREPQLPSILISVFEHCSAAS